MLLSFGFVLGKGDAKASGDNSDHKLFNTATWDLPVHRNTPSGPYLTKHKPFLGKETEPSYSMRSNCHLKKLDALSRAVNI
jgi:hypothetical protein